MVKNRIITLLLWVVVLLWVFSRDRLTEAEHRQRENARFREAVNFEAFKRKKAQKLADDPDFKKHYYDRKFEMAMEDIEDDEDRKIG